VCSTPILPVLSHPESRTKALDLQDDKIVHVYDIFKRKYDANPRTTSFAEGFTHSFMYLNKGMRDLNIRCYTNSTKY
jgi:hypothetical protein